MANLYRPLTALLLAAGWSRIRSGKGDHEIWGDGKGRTVPVDRGIESRHTANGILKRAKLPKAF